MLHSLTLENFKLWRSVPEMRIAPITGLFGANSSGKSSILQALLLLKQTLESSDRSLALSLGKPDDYVEMGLFGDMVWNHNSQAVLQFGLRWSLPEQLQIKDPAAKDSVLFQADQIEFNTWLDSPVGEYPRVKRFQYHFDGQRFEMNRKSKSNKEYTLSTSGEDSSFKFIRNLGRKWPLPSPHKFHGFPDQALTYFQNTGFLPDLQESLEDQLRRIYYLGPLREDPRRRYIWAGEEPWDVGRRGEQTIPALLASRSRGRCIPHLKGKGQGRRSATLEERVAHWLKELGLIHAFTVDRVAEADSSYRVEVRRDPGGPEVLLTDVGFGVSQILPVLVLCYYVPEGSTILFEQPEIHLHPSVQSGLADVFIDVAKHRNVQVIVESHSEHLLNRLQRRIAEQTARPDSVALYFTTTGHTERKPCGRLEQLEVDLFGQIHNWPKDFFGDRFEEMAKMQEAALERQLQQEG
jgi:predicted ATPase